jgi:hypothetical protein
MRKLRYLPMVLVAGLGLGLVVPAQANPDFSPTVSFKPSSTLTRANPKITVTVAQDAGEDSLKSIEFDIPKGFKLPGDAAIQDGEELGQGNIKVALQFLGCSEQGQGQFNAMITERDRKQDEISQGVKAVWVVDLQFTQIDLKVYGSKLTGWQLKANIPEESTQATCPPFKAIVALNKTSSDSHTPIWRNPRLPGRYVLKGKFTSTTDQTVTVRQRLKIHT